MICIRIFDAIKLLRQYFIFFKITYKDKRTTMYHLHNPTHANIDLKNACNELNWCLLRFSFSI